MPEVFRELFKDASHLSEWMDEKADKKPLPVGLDVVLTRRLTREIARAARPDYQQRSDDGKLS